MHRRRRVPGRPERLPRVVPWLRRLAHAAPDAEVREAAQNALDHLVGFAGDIVDSGYQIRTVEDGKLYVPTQDLASFVTYDAVVPNGECNPKLIAALVYLDAEELAYLLEYCRSPWRAGAQVVDCDVVLDPERWGE